MQGKTPGRHGNPCRAWPQRRPATRPLAALTWTRTDRRMPACRQLYPMRRIAPAAALRPTPTAWTRALARCSWGSALCAVVMTVLLAVVVVRDSAPLAVTPPTGGGVLMADATRASVRPCHEQEGTRTRGALASPMYLEACVHGWIDRGSGR